MNVHEDLLNNGENNCSFTEDEVDIMCSEDGDDAYRDNSGTTSDRFVNWTATSETHQRKSNIFII